MVTEVMALIGIAPYQSCAYFLSKKTLEVWGTENDYQIYRIRYKPATGQIKCRIDQLGIGECEIPMSNELKSEIEPLLKTIIKALKTRSVETTVEDGDVIIREMEQ